MIDWSRPLVTLAYVTPEGIGELGFTNPSLMFDWDAAREQLVKP